MSGRIGLVGYGEGGRFFHSPLIASVEGAEFAGVVTRNPDRRALLAADHPGVPAFDDIDQLLAAGVDLVAVSVPPDLRGDLVHRILDAGVAVVVDKPFALSVEQADELVAHAAERNVPLAVFHNRRWDSELLTMQKALADGTVGHTVRFENGIERWEPESAVAPTGGGLLADWGSHLIDQALVLFGPARTVYGEISSVPGYEFETGFVASIVHESGAHSRVFGNCLQAHPGDRMTLLGSAGTITIHDLDYQSEQVWAGESPATLGDAWGVEPQERSAILYTEDGARPIGRERGAWQEYYTRTLAAVLVGSPVPVEARDAVATLRVISAVRASAEAASVVSL